MPEEINKIIARSPTTITRACSSGDLSGLVRLNVPDDVLVVLGSAALVAVGPITVLLVVLAWADVVPGPDAGDVGILMTVPVGENAVTTYSFVPRDHVYDHALKGAVLGMGG